MNPLITELRTIGQKSGEILMDFHKRLASLDIRHKADDSPVSNADDAANRYLTDALHTLTPDIPIISEEGEIPDAKERMSWERCWLIDPLDGTKDFLRGGTGFSVSVALIEANVPVLGMIYHPASKAAYIAERSKGAYKYVGDESIALHTREVDDTLTLALTHACNISNARRKALESHFTLSILEHASAVKFGLVAEGKADLYVKRGPTSEWDTAAGQVILEEAGGKLLDFQGVPLRYNARETLENPWFIAMGDSTKHWLTLLGDMT